MAASSPSVPPVLLKDTRRVHDALLDLFRVLDFRNREHARSHGLSPTQWQALQALLREGPMTVKRLARVLLLEKSTASRLADGLMKKTLVRKRPSPADARRVVLQVTETGQRRARRMRDAFLAEYAGVLAEASPPERRALAQQLEHLANQLGSIAEDGPRGPGELPDS